MWQSSRERRSATPPKSRSCAPEEGQKHMSCRALLQSHGIASPSVVESEVAPIVRGTERQPKSLPGAGFGAQSRARSQSRISDTPPSTIASVSLTDSTPDRGSGSRSAHPRRSMLHDTQCCTSNLTLSSATLTPLENRGGSGPVGRLAVRTSPTSCSGAAPLHSPVALLRAPRVPSGQVDSS